MMKPLVSVIMPTYNNEKYIVESVSSALDQTVKDVEIIIIDDNSTDYTHEVLLPLLKANPSIKYCRLDHNCGPAVARSEAIRISNGKYCAFLDADDLWDKNKLERQISRMEKDKVHFSCTAYRLMDENGTRLNRCLIPPQYIDYRKCIRLGNPIGNLTAMYDQEKLGKFVVPNIRKKNDFALWLQILKKTDYCLGIDEILGTYRFGRKGSVSSNKLKQIKYHWELYHNIETHNCVRSLYEILCWAFVKGTKVGLSQKKIEKGS